MKKMILLFCLFSSQSLYAFEITAYQSEYETVSRYLGGERGAEERCIERAARSAERDARHECSYKYNGDKTLCQSVEAELDVISYSSNRYTAPCNVRVTLNLPE